MLILKTESLQRKFLLEDEVIGSFEFYAGLADKLEKDGDHDLKVPDETLHIVVKKEPLGVCALITPWNVRLQFKSEHDLPATTKAALLTFISHYSL